MKKIKVFIKIILFFTLFIGGQAGIKYMLLDDTMTISRVMMHDLYTEKENIDILFCGASHCQLGIDPEIMDEQFGMNTFNAGSSSQGLATSLALIKEAAAYHDLQQVYVDLDYSIVTRTLPNLESIYIISDYMTPSLRKAEYLLNATSKEYYVNSFMPLHKGRGYTKDPQKIMELVKKKQTEGYRDYTEIDSSYAGKGHIASRTVIEDGSLWSMQSPETVDFSIPSDQQEYLKQIILFCKERDIELTFISIPVTDFHLSFVTNYDEYIQTIKDFLRDYDVEYVDFNLCRTDISGIDSDSYYNDDNHLNTNGANVFGRCFANYFSGEVKYEELFYDSYREKLVMEPSRVLGIRVQRTTEGIEAIPVVSGEGIVPEVDVSRQTDGYFITVSVEGSVTNQIEIEDEELK